jgi:hypothetical protein
MRAHRAAIIREIPMRKIIIAVTVSALALSGATLEAKSKRKTGEEKLSEMVAGHEAGEPVRCIRTSSHNNMTIIDGTAIVYRDGDTVYVNRTANPKSLDWNDVLVIEPMTANRLCRLDRVSTMDRSGGFYTGPVFLQDFVPYKKIKEASAG